MPYLSALEVCSRQGAIQIHVYVTLPYLTSPKYAIVLINPVASVVTFRQTNGDIPSYKTSPAPVLYEIILLDDRGMRV